MVLLTKLYSLSSLATVEEFCEVLFDVVVMRETLFMHIAT
jgi:hypothetical protein